ncbi:hypothetical protein Droror1_Dr00008895 [Drosera rotundifolia]
MVKPRRLSQGKPNPRSPESLHVELSLSALSFPSNSRSLASLGTLSASPPLRLSPLSPSSFPPKSILISLLVFRFQNTVRNQLLVRGCLVLENEQGRGGEIGEAERAGPAEAERAEGKGERRARQAGKGREREFRLRRMETRADLVFRKMAQATWLYHERGFYHSDCNFEVKVGDRIAQLVIEKIMTPDVVEVEVLLISDVCFSVELGRVNCGCRK